MIKEFLEIFKLYEKHCKKVDREPGFIDFIEWLKALEKIGSSNA